MAGGENIVRLLEATAPTALQPVAGKHPGLIEKPSTTR